MPTKRTIKGRTMYVGVVKKQGRRKQKLFNRRSDAVAWESKLRRIPVSDWDEPTATTSLGDWAIKYLDYAQVKFTVKTYKDYRRVFQAFFQSIQPELDVEDLTQGMVLNYLQLQASGRSGNAANKDRKRLVAAWNWGIKYMGLPAPNPCLVERFREDRQTRYIPPERDFWKVYEIAEGQDRTLLLAYLHTAARRNELFNLRWDDVDFAGERIRLWTRKRADGSLEGDWIPLTNDLFNALLEHRQTQNVGAGFKLAHKQGSLSLEDPVCNRDRERVGVRGKGPDASNSSSRGASNSSSRGLTTGSSSTPSGSTVFPNPRNGRPYIRRIRWLKRLCDRAGVKPFGAHAIRHMTASILAEAGVPVIQIQHILRHKSARTTELYLSKIVDLKPALKVLEGKGPLNKSTSKSTSRDGTRETDQKPSLQVV